MSKIPKVSEEAMKESYIKFQHGLNNSIDSGNPIEMLKILREYGEEFLDKQPQVFEFVTKIMEAHVRDMDGIILAPQLSIYIMIILNSMYIQQEIDDIDKLFKYDKEN